jgi:hypothetical protein
MTTKDRLDDLLSLYICYRDNWECTAHKIIAEKKIVPPPYWPKICRAPLQACHLIRRAHSNAYKYDARNLRACCRSINLFGKDHESFWDALWPQLYPESIPLLETARVFVKRTKLDMENQILGLQRVLLPMVMKRAEVERLASLDWDVPKFRKQIREGLI